VYDRWPGHTTLTTHPPLDDSLRAISEISLCFFGPLGKTGFLDFDFPVLDLSCEIPSVLLVFYAEVGGGC
jgi:hypothetical protein